MLVPVAFLPKRGRERGMITRDDMPPMTSEATL
jgi:hypothetical protein